MSAQHKPRRRRKVEDLHASHANQGAVVADEISRKQKPAFPLVAFIWPVKSSVSQWTLMPLILMIVGLFRWTLGLWGYSGFQSPPMHGDFEAQRHWMEITIHLPVSQWYFYDLEWWGLDYPPLTAYHSWIFGKIGDFIHPEWFALKDSRALDDPTLKLYMRATVLLSEYLFYIPAVVICLRHMSRWGQVSTWETSIALVAVLMQPATMLIDHGHFQYNTVMLGLFTASISSMLAGRHLWGSVFFVLALSFKQMALFWAPAIFAFLLGGCIFPRLDIGRLVAIALTTILSFCAVFAPFALGTLFEQYRNIPIDHLPPPALLSALPLSLDKRASYYPIILEVSQSIHRIFPFQRGLFEDKVANLWCALHTFHKLNRYSSLVVQRAALLATLVLILPPGIIIFLRPRREILPFALSATAWGFFLCSYQVHEKNVLLPLLPMTLLLGGKDGLLPSIRAWVGFANLVGVWTLFPLLKRDQLLVPYYTLTLLWAYLLGLPLVTFRWSESGTRGHLHASLRILHSFFYLMMCLWHLGEAFIVPPLGKPDIWAVANVLIGAPAFGICYLWCLWELVQQSQILTMTEPVPSASQTMRRLLLTPESLNHGTSTAAKYVK